METLVRWCAFCAVTGRRLRIDQDKRAYFDVADREDLDYEEKLREYRRLADDYFQADEYAEFCAASLPMLRELVLEYFAGPELDAVLVESVRATFPAHEHDEMVARHRGLVSAWVADQG
jgi:hypothetical protein